MEEARSSPRNRLGHSNRYMVIRCIGISKMTTVSSCQMALTFTQLITLLYGDNFFLFKPDVPADHGEYEMKILQRQCEFFGPFPLTYRELCPQETLNLLAYIMQSIPPERKKPFSRISEKEVSKEDKEFILKIMKLDPRDRPSAGELLQDKWFEPQAVEVRILRLVTSYTLLVVKGY